VVAERLDRGRVRVDRDQPPRAPDALDSLAPHQSARSETGQFGAFRRTRRTTLAHHRLPEQW